MKRIKYLLAISREGRRRRKKNVGVTNIYNSGKNKNNKPNKRSGCDHAVH